MDNTSSNKIDTTSELANKKQITPPKDIKGEDLEENKSEENKSEENKSEENKSEKNKSEENKSEKNKSEKNKSEKNKSEENGKNNINMLRSGSDSSEETPHTMWNVFVKNFSGIAKAKKSLPGAEFQNIINNFVTKVKTIVVKLTPGLSSMKSMLTQLISSSMPESSNTSSAPSSPNSTLSSLSPLPTTVSQTGGSYKHKNKPKKNMKSIYKKFRGDSYNDFALFLKQNKIYVNSLTLKIIKQLYLSKYTIDYIKQMNYFIFILNDTGCSKEHKVYFQNALNKLTNDIYVYFQNKK